MRRFGFFGMAFFLCATAVRAEDAADQPYLVLQSGGHTAAIQKVLFRPDGKQIVTVSEDRTIRLWDRATGERLAVFRLPILGVDQGLPRCAALSPDGKTLAVGGTPYRLGDKAVATIFLIDLDAGAVAATLAVADATVMALAYSHDGKLLAGGDGNGKVSVWYTAGRKVAMLLEGHKGAIRDAAFSPDDKLLATASVDKTARLWDMKTGKEACPPLKHDSMVVCLAWQDDKALFTGGSGNVFIHKWDRTGKHLKQFVRAENAAICSICSLPDKNELFYTWSDTQDDAGDELRKSGGAVLHFQPNETTQDGLTWANHAGPVRGAVSPDGFLAATSGGDDRGVNLWTVNDGKMVRCLTGRGQTPFWAGWAPDGNSVGWINIKKALPQAAPPPAPHKGPLVKAEGKPPEPPKIDNRLQRSFDLAELQFGPKPDANYQQAAHALGDLYLTRPMPPAIEVHSKSAKKDFVCTINPVAGYLSFTLIPGERIALGSGGAIRVYSATTGKLIGTLKGPAGVAWHVSPSPDGRYLLAAFSDQTLRIYDPGKDRAAAVAVRGRRPTGSPGRRRATTPPRPAARSSWAGRSTTAWSNSATFYPAAQFHKAFYRPDVIKRVLAEGSVAKAREAADKASGTTTEAVRRGAGVAAGGQHPHPRGGQAGPRPRSRSRPRRRARTGPSSRCSCLMDGRPCPGAEARTLPNAKPGDKQEATWKVTLPDGEHHLVALAETDAQPRRLPGNRRRLARRRKSLCRPCMSWPSASTPIPAASSSTGRWTTPQAVAKAFQADAAPKPYGKVETKLLLDKDATKDGILAGLDWLKKNMTADDTAVVFYAGHGHRDKKTSQFYMLPVDVDVSDLPKTGVTGTALKEKLKAMPGRVLVLAGRLPLRLHRRLAGRPRLADGRRAAATGGAGLRRGHHVRRHGPGGGRRGGGGQTRLLHGGAAVGAGRRGAGEQGRPDPLDGAELLRRGDGV